jgi:hypothetical protein
MLCFPAVEYDNKGCDFHRRSGKYVKGGRKVKKSMDGPRRYGRGKGGVRIRRMSRGAVFVEDALQYMLVEC